MSTEKILIYLPDSALAQILERTALGPAGYSITQVADPAALKTQIQATDPDLIILGEEPSGVRATPPSKALETGLALLKRDPSLAIIFVPANHSDELELQALRAGFVDYLHPPVRASELVQAARRAIQRRRDLLGWTRREVQRNTRSLAKKLDDLEELQKIAHAISASLELDSVLKAVVDAAVELTGADEGSLLLLDEASGELYVRAARNFQEDFVRTFRVPIQDTLAGQAISSRKPVILDKKTPQKIMTSYLVHSLIYVPLIAQERAIGVLGVDNQQVGRPFSTYHVTLVSALADHAAIAIENARVFARSELARSKLETILRRIKDGIIILDTDRRLVLINQTSRDAFEIGDQEYTGRQLEDIIQNNDLLELLGDAHQTSPYRGEITLEDGRVLNTQATPIPEVGLVITMQDITHLKELDRIKSDFVSTVSHDLRSPLTAILGYVELIERVGPVNAQQVEFIRRVEISVQNITALINDLLDLGRIEAGFDARKEFVPIPAVIHFIIESLRPRAQEKNQKLELDIASGMPPVLGNPVRLKQMLANLVGNAIKYTPKGGDIRISAQHHGEQLIMQVQDNGPGIPPADQPYIFDKFYRASNILPETPGTGLGLAIVKSIVENHMGRIWVDSSQERGTTFTIVLPAADLEL